MTITGTTTQPDPVLLYPETTAFPRSSAAPPATRSSTKTALVLLDLLAVTSALLLATWIHDGVNTTDPTSTSSYFRLILVTLVIWPVVFTQALLYRSRYLGRVNDELNRVARAVATGFLILAGLSILMKIDIARQWLIISVLLVATFLILDRLTVRFLFNRARRQGRMLRTVVIAGRNAEGKLVRDMIEDDPSLGYRFEGFVEDLVETVPGESSLALLGDPTKVMRAVEERGASSVIVATTAIDVGSSNRLIRALTEHGVHVELSSTLCDIAASRLTVRPVGRVPMMYIEPVKRSGWRPAAKRAFDAVAGAALMLLTAPFVAAAALAIKITTNGPVFFRQARVGCDGELFEMVKLRTMVVDAESRLDDVAHLNESSGVLFKVRDDPRITRVGRILRKLSIDELPQFYNVVRGEMSLVGPRPALPREVESWEPALHNRLRVKPGITGMWQVQGRSDADHDSRYAQLDLYYVDNWSLITDLVILVRTVPVVLGSKGQY